MNMEEANPREWVEARIQDNQFTYSLVQLRLVGVILMMIVFARLIVFLFAGLHLGPLEKLSALGGLATWIPLLPLGISLYLLGAGRRRLPREQPLMTMLHYSMGPLALVVLILLPASILYNLFAASRLGIVELTFYQQELLSLWRNSTAICLSLVGGVGLLLLQHQSKAQMKRHRLTPSQFFTPYRPPIGRVRTGSARVTDSV